MNITATIHVHADETTVRALDRILAKLDHLGERMTSNQDHLNASVGALKDAITQAVAELKQQITDGATPEQLDFTALDALVSTEQAEAAADAPQTPAP